MPANHCMPHTDEAKAKMRVAHLGKPAPWKHRLEAEGLITVDRKFSPYRISFAGSEE